MDVTNSMKKEFVCSLVSANPKLLFDILEWEHWTFCTIIKPALAEGGFYEEFTFLGVKGIILNNIYLANSAELEEFREIVCLAYW